MIVEFIGCSGAGKTSLAEGLRRYVQPSGRPILSVDLVRDRPGLRWMRDPSMINLAADVISFPSFVRAYGRDGDFVRFAFDRLRRHAPTTFAKYNYRLNIVRKVGVHELARRASKRKTVLIDEGVVLSAYQLFVYSDAPYADVDLDRFARLVPMPDRIVYVRAPLGLLVERAIRRPDPRRELAGRKRHDVADRLARAMELFEGLAARETIQERLLTVEIADDSREGFEEAVRQVAAGIDGGTHPTSSAVMSAASRLTKEPTIASGDETSRMHVRSIAFVGSEASGKSTILNEVESWLGRDREVRRIHAGKPPSTWLTLIPHALLPTFRALFPEQRLLRVEAKMEEEPPARGGYPLLFAFRSVMLAYERRALINGALRRSRQGTIVLSDRYPSDTGGAPDGPQLGHLPLPSGRPSARRVLAALEGRLYRDIPPPDIVFHLSAPLEVTLARNAVREKREPEGYVRLRHAMSADLHFEGSVVHRVDTDKEFESVVVEIKDAIRGALDGSDPGAS
jgi:thymidylate kinase